MEWYLRREFLGHESFFVSLLMYNETYLFLACVLGDVLVIGTEST